MTYAGPTVFGAAQRPYQGSFWGTQLPSDALLDPNSGSVILDLAMQIVSPNAAPTINVAAWTAEPTVVPASQPLVPVTVPSGLISSLKEIAAAGLPIPAGFAPTPDSDAAGIFWQPDYIDPEDTAVFGRYYEAEGLQYANGAWSASNIARADSVNTDTLGHFGNWTISGADPQNPGDPNSTYELEGYGVQGSGLPYMPGVISYQDLERGFIDHAVCLAVAHAAPGHVWPAQKDDGDDWTTLVSEGMRFRLAAGYTTGGVNAICEMLIVAASKYGIVVTDKTAYEGQNGNLAFRAAPSTLPLFGGVSGATVLAGFPWTHLQLLEVGSDTDPTPV